MASARAVPNILITGTPGTGKSTLAHELVASSNGMLRHLDVSKFVAQHGTHHGYDEEWQTHIVDDDATLDALEPIMSDPTGGIVLDWHAAGTLPVRWLDLVVVLRTPHTILWDRLAARGYPQNKIEENNDAEIMGECLNDALDGWGNPEDDIPENTSGVRVSGRVVELQSTHQDDAAINVSIVRDWIDAHRAKPS